jgi:hypothetical protein
MVNDFDEAPPQFRPPVSWVTSARLDETPNLGAASTREGLARRSASHDVRLPNAALAEELDEPRRVGEVAAVGERTKIRFLGLKSNRVRVCRRDDREPGTGETKTQPSGTAKEINGPRAWLILQPALRVASGRWRGRDASGRHKNRAALIGERKRIACPTGRRPP